MRKIIRVEPRSLVYYHLDNREKVIIAEKNLEILEKWLKTGEESKFIIHLKNLGVINNRNVEEEKKILRKLITQSKKTSAPLRSMRVPEVMNMELTNRCPLKCPQCYCELNQGKDIKKETAFKYIEEAARLQIPNINLSGGETLVYPYLTELLEFINSNGLHSAIAISGWGFNKDKMKELKNAGLNKIFVSLNGSTKKVNSLSRDGYEKAINALQILQIDQEIDYYINWVARNDNVEDFPSLVKLAKDYGVKGIYILACKPDAAHILQETLSRENFLFLADYLKKYNNREMNITVESCFSPLRAYIYNNFFTNLNTGFMMGCRAGRTGMAVDVEGNLIPCRHLLFPEKFDSIEDYWWNSKILERLRRYEDNKEKPCKNCYLTNNCRSCRAIGEKVYHNLYSGAHYCPVPEL